MTFEPVRQYGVSLFASAGVAGIVAGLAARPVLSNLFAGVQLAMTQPIRIDDAVIVENEWGTVEEITSTYVVVRMWDLRRMIVPLTYFIEKPFQNWTRESSALIGTVMFYVDYRAPVGVIRDETQRDRQAIRRTGTGERSALQVTDTKEGTIELRCLMSARIGRPGVRPALRGARKADRLPAEASTRKRCRTRARSAAVAAATRTMSATTEDSAQTHSSGLNILRTDCCVRAQPVAILPRNSSALAASRLDWLAKAGIQMTVPG